LAKLVEKLKKRDLERLLKEAKERELLRKGFAKRES
jgi:hypothetical protein